MKIYDFITGLGELIPCYIVEKRDETIRVRLLKDSKVGTYKQNELIHTLYDCIKNEREFTVKVIDVKNTSYILTGEIYPVLKVKYNSATMGIFRDSLSYKIRIMDGRIGSFMPENFEIL